VSRIAYVNGRYVPHADAQVHVEDRGYQFADGVYEVCEVRGGRLVDEARHARRLDRSLRELRIAMPMSPIALGAVLREVVRLNRVNDGLVYLQITRGVAPRDHAFPVQDIRPSVVVTAHGIDQKARRKRAQQGIAVITLPDNRWERVDIKTVGLLPNVLAKQAARDAGAYEAWFVDREGRVTEGSSTNAWIVSSDGVLLTRHAERGILRGVARTVLFDVTSASAIRIEERAFTVAEAQRAREAFITSATAAVTPVVAVDGKIVADGKPGKVTRELQGAFYRHAEMAPLRAAPPVDGLQRGHFPR
jgi:D-alanine transaminase